MNISKKKLDAFRSHLKSANNGEDISEEILWRFLRSFHLLAYDLDSDSSISLSLLQALIAQSAKDGQPDAIWGKVLTYIQSANQTAGTITLDTIPKEIQSCFSVSVSRNWQADLQKLYERRDLILGDVRTDIAGVHIERRDIFYQLLEISEKSNFVLLTGVRGCGKSSINKEFAQFMNDCHPVFCLRTEDLNESHLDKALAAMGIRSSLSELAAGFSLMPKKFLLIESLEKLLELENRGAFTDLIQFLRNNPGWTVIASGRDYAYQQITFHFLQPYGIGWSPLTIPEFSSADVDFLCSQIQKLKPLADNPSTRSLLRSPFLADFAARVVATGTQFTPRDSETTFREAVWRDVISKEHERSGGLPLTRKKTFISIAVKRAKSMTYGVSAKEFDSEVVFKLEEDNMIRRDPNNGLVTPAHDVLEDWALEAFIEEAYQQNPRELQLFLEAIGSEPAMVRGFRLWLHRKLRTEDTEGQTRDLVLGILRDADIQPHWKDETISAVLMGDTPLEFLTALSDKLFENNGELLKRFCFLLRISCKAPDHDLIKQITDGVRELSKATEFLLLKPYGKGWEATIIFLYEHKNNIYEDLLPHIVAVLDEWSSLIHIEKELPRSSREASLLALYLLEMVKDSYQDEGDKNKLLKVIIKTIPVIRPEFTALLERDVFRKENVDSDNRRPYYVNELLKMVLVDFETVFLCKHAPDLLIRIAWQEWLLDETHNKGYLGEHLGVPKSFGLYEFRDLVDFFPASGLKGPFSHLLHYHPQKGLDFIIELCNRTAEKYAHSTLDSAEEENFLPADSYDSPVQVEIPLSDGIIVKQYGSHRLWSGYRGISVFPDMLQSALMALENWLIAINEQYGETENVEWIVDHILRNSNSVMTTAVIASVATGFPSRMGKTALPLLWTPELYHWDLIRSIHERGGNEIDWFRTGLRHEQMQEIFTEERRKAALRPWRKEHLEYFAIRLQLAELREEIFKILDYFHENIPKAGVNGESDEDWRFRLHRIDVRGWEPQADQENKRILFMPKNLEPDLQEIQDKAQENFNLTNRYLTLRLWSDKTFKGEPLEREYYTSWQEALQEAKTLLKLIRNGDVNELTRMQVGGIAKAAALFLRDHNTEMKDEELKWCAMMVVETVLANADSKHPLLTAEKTDFDGAAASAEVLPILLDYVENENEDKTTKLRIATALTHANENVRRSAASGIRKYLWQRDSEFAQICIDGALEYARLHSEEIKNRLSAPYIERQEKSSESEKPEAWLDTLRDRFAVGDVTVDPTTITFESHSAWHILLSCLMIPDGSTNPEHISLMKRILLMLLKAEEKRKRRHYDDKQRMEIPVELSFDFSKRLADFIISLPETDSMDFFDLSVDQVELASNLLNMLMLYLLIAAEKRGNVKLYWNFWNLLSSKVQEIAIRYCREGAYSITLDDPRILILGMLFSDISWQRKRPEEELIAIGADHILNFVENAGINPLVFEAMTHLIHYYPKLFMLKGIAILAKHQENIGGKHLLSGTNTVFYLERVLQRLLILESSQTDLPIHLRDASLILLNAMVETGSSCAYFLRDHLIHSGCK